MSLRVDSKNYEIADLLLQQPGINVTMHHSTRNQSILHLLAEPLEFWEDQQNNDSRIILRTTMIRRIVVDHGLDIDIRDDDGKTPLLLAVYNANEPIARILIELGADITAQDDDGLSIIFQCIHNQYSRSIGLPQVLELFSYLLENHGDSFDLDRGSKSDQYYTPVIFACQNNHVPILKTLVEKYNAELQPDPDDPNSALNEAIYCNASEVIDYLLTNHRHLFDINALDGNLTPFLYCCQMMYVDCAMTLLQHGADYSIKSVNQSLSHMDLLFVDHFGNTISASHQLKTFSALVTAYPHIFDVNCTVDALRNGDQCSALLLACRNDNIDLLKVLVEHGVNLDVEDVNGLNIVHYASQSVGTSVLWYLFETHLQSTHHHHKLATAFTKPTDTIHAMNPVMMACKYSRFATAHFFISRDDFDVLRKTNNTRFEFGQTSNREPQQSRTLLHLSCDYHPAGEREYKTVECPDLVELLIEKVIALISS